jgi:hypothetical protein
VKGYMFRTVREEQKRGEKIVIIASTEIYQSAFLHDALLLRVLSILIVSI